MYAESPFLIFSLFLFSFSPFPTFNFPYHVVDRKRSICPVHCVFSTRGEIILSSSTMYLHLWLIVLPPLPSPLHWSAMQFSINGRTCAAASLKDCFRLLSETYGRICDSLSVYDQIEVSVFINTYFSVCLKLPERFLPLWCGSHFKVSLVIYYYYYYCCCSWSAYLSSSSSLSSSTSSSPLLSSLSFAVTCLSLFSPLESLEFLWLIVQFILFRGISPISCNASMGNGRSLICFWCNLPKAVNTNQSQHDWL